MRFIRKLLLGEEFLEVPSRLSNLECRVGSLESTVERIDSTVERLNTTVTGLNGRVGNANGAYLEGRIKERLHNLPYYMGLVHHEEVPYTRISALAAAAAKRGLTTEIEYGKLRSFRDGDAFVAAYDGDELVYIALEISVTGARYDIERAQRNAAYLTLFTGVRALPALACAQIGDDIADEVIHQDKLRTENDLDPVHSLLPEDKVFWMEMEMAV